MPTLAFKVGGEQKVNLTADDNQAEAKLTALSDGGWLVTWTAAGQDQVSYDIYQQRYDRNGQAVFSADKLVNTMTSANQCEPSIAGLSDGGWLVTWTSYSQDGSGAGIYQQRFDAEGNPQGGEIRVNDTTLNDQYETNTVALSDGGWLVTWTCLTGNGSGQPHGDIYQQRYSKTGQALYGAEKPVNTTTADQQDDPCTAVLADGGWITTWTSLGQDGSAYGVYQQRFDAEGHARGGETRVNITTEGSQIAQVVTSLADGGWVVAWGSYGETGGIYQQRYDKDGNALYSEDRRVSTLADFDLATPSVAALADGGWLVTWWGDSIDAAWEDRAERAIYQQRFDKDGNALYSSDQRVSTTADHVADPSVVGLADGGWVAIWNSSSYDSDTGSSRNDIYQQRYELNTAPQDIGLSGNLVSEAASAAAVIGTLAAADRHAAWGDAFTYELLDDAGGRFTIEGQQLKVAHGALLDYGQARSHSIRVKVTDTGGLSFEKDLTIHVSGSGANPDNTLMPPPGGTLTGTRGKDVLKGGIGADKLYGGYGNDKLTGGLGQDIFVFNSKLGTSKTDRKKNLDTITDFSVKDDTLWLDNKIFKKLGKKGTEASPAKLNKKFFKIGTEAKDKNDYLVYNKKTGYLSYDKDGSGAAKAVEFARLDKKLKLTDKDFFVI